MRNSRLPRRGFTIIEMLVSLIVVSIIGATLTRFVVANSRLMSNQDAWKGARSVSRTALDRMVTDLRSVEATAGLIAASTTDLTVRVPYALGVVCDATGAVTTVSLLPTDSLVYAGAAWSGYAWRDNLGQYTYVETGTVLGVGSAAACLADSVTTLPGGRVIALAPGVPNGTPAGSVLLLFQRIRYQFKASAAFPGRIGLWRTLVASGTTEELASPFNNTAGFRFYVQNRDTAQTAVPSPLSSVAGLELLLDGTSLATPYGAPGPKVSHMTTAIFFQNRMN